VVARGQDPLVSRAKLVHQWPDAQWPNRSWCRSKSLFRAPCAHY
jgi:hypothetical protein